MFVPIALLMQQEKPLNSPEDVIQALDKWVMPKYPNYTTSNPSFTKQECFGVINSYQQAGRLHLQLKAQEIEKAVDAFLQERLWVSEAEISRIVLNPNFYPSAWLVRPTFWLVAKTIPRVIWEAFTVIVNMISTAFKYTYYSFKPEREFRIPTGEGRKPVTNLTVLKKDS